LITKLQSLENFVNLNMDEYIIPTIFLNTSEVSLHYWLLSIRNIYRDRTLSGLNRYTVHTFAVLI